MGRGDQQDDNDNKVRRHVCHVCGRCFKKGNQLNQHMIIHRETGKMPFCCVTCGQTFSRKSHLKSHEVTHTRDSLYQCEMCHVVCPTKSNLQRHHLLHLRNKHACPHCKKIFKDEESLEDHIQTHSHICHHCGKTYMHEGNLQNHILSHVTELPCRICGKVFNSNNSLKLHLRVHKAHTCDVCGNSFEGIRSFREHMASPHLYACDVCGRRFPTIVSYNHHMNNHSVHSETAEIETEDDSSIDQIDVSVETAAVQNHDENCSTRTGNVVNFKDCSENTVSPVLSSENRGGEFLKFNADTNDDGLPTTSDFFEFIDDGNFADLPELSAEDCDSIFRELATENEWW